MLKLKTNIVGLNFICLNIRSLLRLINKLINYYQNVKWTTTYTIATAEVVPRADMWPNCGPMTVIEYGTLSFGCRARHTILISRTFARITASKFPEKYVFGQSAIRSKLDFKSAGKFRFGYENAIVYQPVNCEKLPCFRL